MTSNIEPAGLTTILIELRETCPEVIGCILLDKGTSAKAPSVLASDLPPLFSACRLDFLARQGAYLYDAFEDALPKKAGQLTFEDAVIKCDSLWCYCRRTIGVYLIIIVDTGANLAKLRGFSAMALRKIGINLGRDPQRKQ